MTTTMTSTATSTATAPLDALEMATPAGVLAVLLTPEDGIVRAAGFAPVPAMATQLTAGLSARGWRPGSGRHPVAGAVAAYGEGDTLALDAVPIAQPGGEFRQLAWRALRSVPAGETISYAALAALAGRPAAVRAAGTACARNLVAPFVPCHRVVRSDGSLGGYRYGLPVKERLLAHESTG